MKVVVLLVLCGLLVNCGLYPEASADGSTQIVPQRSEIVFVDTGVANYGQLLADLQARHDAHRRFKIHVLDGRQNGIEQISKVLAGYRGVDAIHVLSHGTDGAVQLGNTWLHVDHVDAHARAVANWREALSRDADVLFYGCNVARSQRGRALIQAVSTFAGADVAASADATGHTSLGGDWALEYAVGDIETDLVSSRPWQVNWVSVLDMATFQQGINSYTDARDTELDDSAPDTNNGGNPEIELDDNPIRLGLLRFDNMFGSGANQIPLGSTINWATLTVTVSDPSVSGANIDLHRMLVDWTESSTWNSMGNGVDRDDVEAISVFDGTLLIPDQIGPQTFTDLQAALQAWSNGDDNYGWVMVNDNDQPWRFYSSDELTVNFRPLLTVDYTPGVTVTNTNNSGPGSLRQAIIDANALGGPATIIFNIPLNDLNHYYYRDDGIPGSLSLVVPTTLNDASISDFDPDYPFTPRSWYTIRPNTALPNIASDVIVDATTQPGYAGTPIIELDGSSVASNVSGLSMTGDNSTVRGLVINRFTGHGILLTVGDNNVIEGSYIGIDVSGTISLGNGKQGIQIENTSGHTIGGTTPGAANVISGNTWSGVSIQLGGSSDNVIQGNLIGTDATGTVALGNGNYGVDLFNGGPSSNLIGGTTPGAGNVISGNAWEGVQIRGFGTTNNTVAGNAIGTDPSGTLAVPNALGGILIEQGATNNTIGGTVAGSDNVIAFNSGDGVKLADPATDANVIQGNSIFSNAGLGIDLNIDGVTSNDDGDGDGGPNSGQNFPVLTSANTDGVANLYLGGVINSTALRTFRIEFFANSAADPGGHGEGETYLGFTTVTTDPLGDRAFSTILPAIVPVGSFITATATDQTTNDTSEFSPHVPALDMYQAVVDTTNDLADAPDLSSITALLSNRGGDNLISLREAIRATNATSNGATPDEIRFHIPDIDPNHYYYQDDTIVGVLSTVFVTVLDDPSITDFDPDYPLGPGYSWFSIHPGTNLPAINDAVILDGTTQPGFSGKPIIELDGTLAAGSNGLVVDFGGSGTTIRGLVINRFGQAGIWIHDADGNKIEGNYIGTDVSGTLDRGNTDDGVSIDTSDGNTIGGAAPGAGNVISGNNNNGINIDGSSATGNVVQGNVIGSDLSGVVTTLGNSNHGIILQNSARNNTIGGTAAGEANIIAFNAAGVAITQNGSDLNQIRGNSIYSNTGLGIDLNDDGPTLNDPGDGDGGENDFLNYPVITSAVTNQADTITISGTLDSLDLTNFDLDFFYTLAEGGEGQIYLGSVPVSTNDDGNASFNNIPFAPFAVPDAAYITATATVTSGSETGNTSEFSEDFQATNPNNQPPTASIPASSYPVFEHTPFNLHLIGMSVSDPDAGTNDVLATLSVSEGTLTVNVGGTGVTVGGSGTSSVTLNGMQTEINDVLSGNLGATIVYTALADPGLSANLTLTLNDLGHSGAGGPMSDNDTATLNITAENDDPGNTGTLPTDVVVTEDVATQMNLSAIDLADADSGSANLTMTFSTSTGGTLSASDSGGVTVGGSGTGTLTLNGTVAALNTFLDAPTNMQYWSASNAAGDNADSLTIDVTDHGNTGSGGGGIIPFGSVNVDITPVGDTPQVASVSTLEDTQSGPIVLNRHAADGLEVTHFRISNITGGTLYHNDGSTAISSGAYILLAQGNAGLRFTPSPNSTAAGSFDVESSENGSTVAAQSGTATSTIMVTPVNDAPVLDNTGTMTLTDVIQDSDNPTGNSVASIISSAGGDPITDSDSGAVEGIAVIGVDDTNGTWEYSTDGGSIWQSFVVDGVANGSPDDMSAVLLADIDLVRFVPNPSYTGPAGDMTFHAWDQTSGASGDSGINASVQGGASAYSIDTETATLSVLALSGVTNLVPGAQTIDEDASLLFSSGKGNLIVVDDGSGADPVLQTSLSVTSGLLTLATTTGLTFDSGADGTSDMTISGLESAINTALNGLSYDPTGDYHGPETLQVTTGFLGSLLAHYSFDNVADPGNDDSPGGAHDGTVNGGTLPAFDPVRGGNVLPFDGTNDNVHVPGLIGTPSNITLAAWVNMDAGFFQDELISLGDNVFIRLDAPFLGDGVVGAFYDGFTWRSTASNIFIAGTGWHHIAYTVSTTNNEQVLYIDGIPVATDNYTGSIFYGLGTETYIGRHGISVLPGYFLHGKVDDAMIFDYPLTAAEIASLFAGGSGVIGDTDGIAITVTPVGDTPSVTSTSTLEDMQTTSGLMLSRYAADGPEVTHFRISNITGGALYQNDGVTMLNSGDFILVAQGQAGLKFTPSPHSTTPGSFNVESSEDGFTVADQSGIATATISLTPVGDTPSVTHASTFEDAQTASGLVISRHASDGAEVTHFNITTITGGTLYHTDGVTAISNGDFITVAQGNNGLKFTPAPDSITPGSFNVESSEDGFTVAAQSGVATATISVTPVGDTPQAASIATFEDTQSGAIVLDRHVNDGAEVTHLRISNIGGGTLYYNDGVTVINAGVYITVAQGNSGLKFTPAPDSTTPGSFNVESSEDGLSVAAQSGVATSTLTIIPVGDTPQVANISTLEDMQSGPIGLDRNSNDGLEVTHLRISNIGGGTLYHNDGVTVINAGDFITVAQGQAGLTFTPTPGSTTPGRFDVESSEDGTTVAAQSGVATATITILTTSGLWLSTDDDVASPSQVPGLDSWGQDKVLAFDEPNFNLEPGTTDGTLYSVFPLDLFALDGDADVKGVHYVSQDITVGGAFFPAIDLFTGDLLLIVDASETLDGTGANLLSVTSQDVFVFRPDVAGDYSAGTFLLLLQAPSGEPLNSISLVENLTLVGDVILDQGTFIFSQMNSDDDAIYHFATDDVGTNTSGFVSVLLDGSEFGLDQPVAGLDLVEQSLIVGGVTLQAGTLLVTLESDDGAVGMAAPISTTQQDLFALDVTTTHMGSGTSAAAATLLLEGSDVGLNTDAEDLDAVTLLATVVNNPPTAVNSTVNAVEDTSYSFTVGDFQFSDPDGGSLALLRIKTVETAGDLELSGAAVTAAQVISAIDIGAGNLKFTPAPDTNGSNYATFEFYVHDGIEYSDNSYTMIIHVAEHADTPSVTSTTTDEDTQSSTGLEFSLNAADGESVTHFKITAISGGFLYQNDGMTAINSGDFITFVEGNAGLTFTPAPNSTADGSFSVQASTANNDTGLGGNTVTATVTVTPVGDTPQATSMVTMEDTPSGPVVLDRHIDDGPEVTHFKITNITGGTLVHTDGVTVVNQGDFITVAQGNAGLQFIPSPDSNAVGRFDVESSEDGLTVASQSGSATATISVTPVADTPSVTPASTLEDTPTTSGLVLSRHAADGLEVTHFKITGIAGGALYHSDGTTVINSGDFITAAQGNAGLTFTPSLNSTAPGSFDVQASTMGLDSGLGGATATAAIHVSPVNDGPSASIALTSYAASEGTPLILNGTGLLVGDLDAGASTVRVTLRVGEGSLTVSPGSTGVTVSGSGSTSVTFEGALAEINDVLAGHLDATITYEASAVTDTVLTLHIDDLGASGTGGLLTASATVTLTIAAKVAGNNSPTALSVSPNAVDENTDTSSGYRIGTLTATDPDSADTLTYTIVGGADADKFSIGGAAADDLMLRDGILDHETTSSYDVTVRVIDSGGRTLDATLTITVTDLATLITAGQSFSVTEADADGTRVGTVETTGDDPTAFAITGGDVNSAFAIDASGTLTVADSSALNFDPPPSYTLTIEVSDGTHATSETVTITVLDVAETSSGSGSGTGSNPSSTDEAALIDPTPINPEAETPEPVSEDSSPSTPTPAEDVSPEPQESEPQESNPRTPNPQTPSPQALAPPPTRLGTANNSFIPGLPSVSGPNSGRVNTPAPTDALSATWPDEEMIPIDGSPAEELRPLDDLRPLMVAEGLLQELDGMRDEMVEEVAFSQVAVGSTLTFATGLSIGYVLWLIRGGLLLSSLLSSLPAWRFVDPLPVLTHLDTSAQEEDAEDDSLEAVLQKGAEMANAQRETISRMTVERDVDEPEGPYRT